MTSLPRTCWPNRNWRRMRWKHIQVIWIVCDPSWMPTIRFSRRKRYGRDSFKAGCTLGKTLLSRLRCVVLQWRYKISPYVNPVIYKIHQTFSRSTLYASTNNKFRIRLSEDRVVIYKDYENITFPYQVYLADNEAYSKEGTLHDKTTRVIRASTWEALCYFTWFLLPRSFSMFIIFIPPNRLNAQTFYHQNVLSTLKKRWKNRYVSTG